MKKHFITYGSGDFIGSAKAISKQALDLGLFNEATYFTKEDLPISLKSSPLFLLGKGDGYWIWKPYFILKTLQKLEADDILVYSDAGSSIKKSSKWENYFDALEHTNILFFQYRNNFDYGWKKFNPRFSDSPKIKYWAKKSLINHFSDFKSIDFENKNKLLAGFMILKNTAKTRKIITEWLNTMLYYPQLVIDVELYEENKQIEGFALHRHDQAVISILSRIYESKNEVLILDEEFETEHRNQVIKTMRIRTKIKVSLYRKIINQFRNLFNDKA